MARVKQADVLRHANRQQNVLTGLSHPGPFDTFLGLRKQDGLTPDMVRSELVKIPPDAEGIVGDSAIPT